MKNFIHCRSLFNISKKFLGQTTEAKMVIRQYIRIKICPQIPDKQEERLPLMKNSSVYRSSDYGCKIPCSQRFFLIFFLRSHENCSFAARSLSSVEKYEEKTLGPRHCKNTKNENINNGTNQSINFIN